MKIIFMGTPDFAVPSLEELAAATGIGVKAVVTQPDRPRGRGQQMQATPVKASALELGIPVLQTDNVNQKNFLNRLNDYSPDLIVVVAFGQKLSAELLSLPAYGCINLHASLLPEYRGSSPIHQAIIDGKKITGVSTMHMAEGWDNGDIIYQKEVEIKEKDTVGTLHDKLALVGAGLLVRTVLALEKGEAPRQKQDESMASFAYKIEKSRGLIDWQKPAPEIVNLIRGVNPWPGAYTYLDGDMLKIWEASVIPAGNKQQAIKLGEGVAPGQVIAASSEKGLLVQTGQGQLRVKKIQLAGRRRMSTKEFLRGYNIDEGVVFSEETNKEV